MDKLKAKLKRLKEDLKKLRKVVIAFSGGVDSTLLVKMAKDALGRQNVIAVTATSSTFPRSELEDARRLAKLIGVRHVIIKTGELKDASFRANPPQRCYYCKSELFDKIRKLAGKEGFKHIADASNYDDKKDFRPGRRALKEKGILSPLKEARFTKDDIRRLSKKLSLPTWDKPAYACLASRIPYYEEITETKLRAIEAAEDMLRQKYGFKQVRVRCHGDVARIEVVPSEIKRFFKVKMDNNILKRFNALGFKYVTVDLKGYRAGSMNEVL